MKWFKRKEETPLPAPVVEENLKTYEEIQVGQWVYERWNQFRVMDKEDHNLALILKTFNNVCYDEPRISPLVMGTGKAYVVDPCGEVYNDMPCILPPNHHESWPHMNEQRDQWKTLG